MAGCVSFWTRLNRKKTLSEESMTSPLKRCLTLLDVSLMGVGYMVGSGVYTLTGTVVRNMAGPGAVVSYFVAAVAATLSALCYSELGGRVPLAGSAYTYTYITIGEVWAFLVGWNMILEYFVGSAVSAKAWSGTLDSLCNHSISRGITDSLGTLSGVFVGPYLDFIALGVILVASLFVCVGVKTTSVFNGILAVLNVVTLLVIILTGFSLSDASNWSSGFLPYGMPGVFSGAATCFFAFIGFDQLATAGEEIKNPQRVLPLATGISMAIVGMLYVLATIVLTLMVPYTEIDTLAPFPEAFNRRGITWAHYVVSIGSLFGIMTSTLGGLFSLPRVVYAMSVDGLVFSFLGRINDRTQTPVYSVLLFGLAGGLMALLIDMHVLVELMSIGTLLSFSLVAISVILLRYSPAANPDEHVVAQEKDPDAPGTDMGMDNGKTPLVPQESNGWRSDLLSRIRHVGYLAKLDDMTGVLYSLVVMVAGYIILLCTLHYSPSVSAWWVIVILIVSVTTISGCLILICSCKQTTNVDTFQVPLVPLLPALSVMFNLWLMWSMSPYTWLRLFVWILLGLLVYFLYGYRNSKENASLSSHTQLKDYGSQR